MPLDEFSAVPYYIQLADVLETRVRSGDFEPPNSRTLPSRRELAETYDVSSETADKAVRLLDERGLVIRARGRGVFAKPLAELPPHRGQMR